MNETDKWGRNLADAERWKNVQTLDDVAELTALWLDGDSTFYPYWLSSRPAEETQSIITPLIDLNRSGFWTNSSQPGVVNEIEEEPLKQRNFVTGRIHRSNLFKVSTVLLHTNMIYLTSLGKEASIPASLKGYFPTSFVGKFHNLEDPNEYNILANATSTDFVDYLKTETVEIHVLDPVWGRNDVLLPTLTSLFEQLPYLEM